MYQFSHPFCLNWLLISMQWKLSIWKHLNQFLQIHRYQLNAAWCVKCWITRSLLIFQFYLNLCHLQGKKWDFSFTSIWNTVVWLMLMNFFIKIVNSTAQMHLKKEQESELTALSKKSDSDTQWNALLFLRFLWQDETWSYSWSLHGSYFKNLKLFASIYKVSNKSFQFYLKSVTWGQPLFGY